MIESAGRVTTRRGKIAQQIAEDNCIQSLVGRTVTSLSAFVILKWMLNHKFMPKISIIELAL